MRAVISYQPRRGLGSRLTLPENTFSSFAHAFHLRPRSGVHRVTCPTCAGEDGEQELPPMYDPREDLGR